LPASDVTFEIRSRDDLEDALDRIAQRYEKRDDISALLRMGVCPNGLFDQFTLEGYRAADFHRASPLYRGYEMPAILARVLDVITDEEAKITAERPKET